MTPSRKHQHHTPKTDENMDESGRPARPRRRSWTDDGNGRRKCLRQVLQNQLQHLRQVLRWQVRLLLQELLQVTHIRPVGVGLKKPAPAPRDSLR